MSCTKKVENIERQKISKKVLSLKNDICICEKVTKNVHINDNGVDFGKLSVYLKNKKILSPAEYNLVDWVRKERNRIHLQGLSNPDTGYTKHKVEKIGKVIMFLTEILIR